MKAATWLCVIALFFFPVAMAMAQSLPPVQTTPLYTPSVPQTPITITPIEPKVTTSLINTTWPLIKGTYQGTIGLLCSTLSVAINTLISGGFNIATITAWLNSCAAGAAGLIGGLGGGAGALVSLGVSLLNAVGSAFVLFLQGIGFTIEGILGLAAIGAILSLIVNILNFAYTTVMGIVNLAYTSGVGGIAIASLLLTLINMALSTVLIAIDVILLFAVLVLYVFSGLLFFILVLSAPIVFFITLVIFFLFGLVTLAFKLQASLANLAAFPTGLITFLISIFTGILNIGSWILTMFNSATGLIFSILAAIGVILIGTTFIFGGAVFGFIFLIFLIITGAILGSISGLIGGIFIGLILGVIVCIIIVIAGLVIGAFAGLVIGALVGFFGVMIICIAIQVFFMVFFGFGLLILNPFTVIILSIVGGVILAIIGLVLGAIAGVVIGAIVGVIVGALILIIVAILGVIAGGIILGFIGLVAGLIGGALIFFASFFGPIFAILAWFVILPAIYIIIFIINLILSIGNFGEIMLESIVGVITIIVNSIALMVIKMFVDMLEITAISEIVTTIVMFLQRVQETAPLTKIVAYPLEMLLGIAMLLFAVILAGCTVIFYPFNFVWQFIGRGLSSCYRIICGPFIRPLGYEVGYV